MPGVLRLSVRVYRTYVKLRSLSETSTCTHKKTLLKCYGDDHWVEIEGTEISTHKHVYQIVQKTRFLRWRPKDDLAKVLENLSHDGVSSDSDEHDLPLTTFSVLHGGETTQGHGLVLPWWDMTRMADFCSSRYWCIVQCERACTGRGQSYIFAPMTVDHKDHERSTKVVCSDSTSSHQICWCNEGKRGLRMCQVQWWVMIMKRRG